MHLSSDSPNADQSHLVPYLMRRALRSFELEWQATLRTEGMTVGRWQLLAILSEYDGARLGQLAVMSGNPQAVASRVIDQMERDGLVRRRPARDDGRAVEVWLTAAGRRTFSALLPEADRLVEVAMRGVEPNEVGALIAALATMVTNLDGDQALAPIPELQLDQES